jgi:preprotein translocase subunit SecD
MLKSDLFAAWFCCVMFGHLLIQTPQPHKVPQLLATGWYAVSEQPTNYKRQADRTNQVYYIDPAPVVSVKHFKRLKLSESRFMSKNYPVLVINFDDTGTVAWKTAINSALHTKFALIIDNKLIVAPTVSHTANDNSVTVMGYHISIHDLKEIRDELNEEMK